MNGSLVRLEFSAATPNLNFTNASGPTYIGADAQGHWFTGWMDEVRMSSNARSAEWVATEYNNQGHSSAFYSVSGPEDGPPGS